MLFRQIIAVQTVFSNFCGADSENHSGFCQKSAVGSQQGGTKLARKPKNTKNSTNRHCTIQGIKLVVETPYIAICRIFSMLNAILVPILYQF